LVLDNIYSSETGKIFNTENCRAEINNLKQTECCCDNLMIIESENNNPKSSNHHNSGAEASDKEFMHMEKFDSGVPMDPAQKYDMPTSGKPEPAEKKPRKLKVS
jgi:hypothetical protein